MNMNPLASLISLLALFSLWNLNVEAQASFEECNKVLEGDLFNKMFKDSSDVASYKQYVWKYYLTMNEKDAWDSYSHAYNSQVEESDGGKAEIPLDVIDLGLSGHHDYKHRMTESEFHDQYNATKNLNTGSSLTNVESLTSRISTQRTFTRDSASIAAWEKCVTKLPQPGLYAYGYRDDVGDASLKVIWNPGEFALSIPHVEVEFKAPKGVKILDINKGKPEDISVGSGKAYVVETSIDDKTILVNVNASVPKKYNATYQAIIPPKKVADLNFPPVKPVKETPTQTPPPPPAAPPVPCTTNLCEKIRASKTLHPDAEAHVYKFKHALDKNVR